ncbi:hypothetical protein [Luteibacter sp.]|uniref:hypothetical protein n=1 Tax=Luteibacter sp. TaxID=1886636 RepID=UPI002F4022B7
MGKVIEFLARLGGDAALRHASADTVRMALLEAGVEGDELGDALSANDGDALRALLGQRELFCSQMPDGPAHEEEDPVDGEDEDEDEDGDGEPDENVSHSPPADPFR